MNLHRVDNLNQVKKELGEIDKSEEQGLKKKKEYFDNQHTYLDVGIDSISKNLLQQDVS